MTKKFNSRVSGASLEGKVLAVDGEKVKLHLDIDEKQSKEEASWFTYAPPTGNMMYSMPLVGTTASLYFADETQLNPTIVNCIRKNGSGCAKTSDTSKRYFGTEHGSEIEMTPEAINIKGGSKEPLSISFDDNIGVTITSPKKLTLTADEEIIFKTPKSISLKAQSQILLAKTNTKSGVSMETDFQFLSNKVIQDGRDREAFAPFDDAPKKPDPPEKKGFNWGALAIVVVAAVVAVAVTVATAGMAGPLAVALTGAVVGACIGVGSVALGDVISGEHSSLKTYLIAGFVGAVSGAIFSPFQAIKSLGGMLKLGATTGAFESGITQLLESGGINPLRLIQDTALGIATAGLFHGAGKVFTKCAPFVKKAFGKVCTEMADNFKALKYAFKNMEPSKNIKLGMNGGNVDIDEIKAFVKQFKNAKDEIKSGTKGGSKAGVGKTGEGIPLEEVKPDVLNQIHPDDNGAYGYLPNEGTSYYKPEYDFTDVDWAKDMQNVRKDYLEASKQLEIDIEKMTSEGFSKEDIAKHAVDARNQQKVTARANMTAEERVGLEARNIEIYGNPIGPDSQWLFNKTKKKLIKEGTYINDNEIWRSVIKNSMKKDDVINTLLGLIH